MKSKIVNNLYKGRVVPENIDQIEPGLREYLNDPDVLEIIQREKSNRS